MDSSDAPSLYSTNDTRMSQATSTISLPYGNSICSREEKELSGSPNGKTKRSRHNDKDKWYSNVKRWLAVSEPSAQAMKAHKKSTYKEYGIDLKDERAAAKLHFPIGEVPLGATTSSSGPRPEKVLEQKVRLGEARKSCVEFYQTTQSLPSVISSTSTSSRGSNSVTPWEL